MRNDTFKRIQVRAQAAMQNVGTSTSNANDLLLKVKDWVRNRYSRIARAYPWQELVRTYTFATVASTTDYALRLDVDEIIRVFDQSNGREVFGKTLEHHKRFISPVRELAGNVITGIAEEYHEIGTKSVSALLSIADKAEILSTSSADTTPKVIQVAGKVSGVRRTEEIILTGTTGAESSNTYDSGEELEISAGTNDGTLSDLAGTVTIRENTTTTNTLSQIASGERIPIYRWIQIRPSPAAAATLEVSFKKIVPTLVNDNDIPLIPCANEIIEGIIADALAEDGQDQIAQQQEVKFSNQVQELWASRVPKNITKQFVPDNEDTEFTTNRILFS